MQANKQKQAVQEQLNACRREMELSAALLQKTYKERDELARDKANITVQLTSEQRKSKALAQDLAALRCVYMG